MQNHVILRDDIGFSNLYEVPTNGQAGGIVLLWHDHLLNVENIAMTEQEIHVMIHVIPSTQKWLFLLFMLVLIILV